MPAADRERSSQPSLVFRVDDSRPQWRRDALDGLLDYHVVGSAMWQYPRLVFDRKRRFGEIVVEYGGTNPVQASNLQPVGWTLDAWSLGADGVLPWQTIGTAGRGSRVTSFRFSTRFRTPAEARAAWPDRRACRVPSSAWCHQ